MPFQGVLSLHGIEKPVSGTVKAQRNGNQLNVAASFGLKVTDYGIAIPSFAGVTMAESVDIDVQFVAPLVTP